MDDQYAIFSALTEFREGWNEGNVERVLSAFAPEFTNWSEYTPSFYGGEGRRAMELRLRETFAENRTQMAVIIIDIAVNGSTATDYGWLKLTLTPKKGGEVVSTKYRYYHSWTKQADGNWKIDFVMTNKELAGAMLPDEALAS